MKQEGTIIVPSTKVLKGLAETEANFWDLQEVTSAATAGKTIHPCCTYKKAKMQALKYKL